jgi:hypothetical protein
MAVTPLGQTFSAGLAQCNGVETSDELVARADAAQYTRNAPAGTGSRSLSP